MSRNIYGGGATTTLNGLKFEQETSLKEALSSIPGYTIDDNDYLFFQGNYIGMLAGKHDLYRKILEPHGIDYMTIISKKLLPDEALYLDGLRTIFIIEKKFQNVAGSVDEKLQTCLFKKIQYHKLFSPININVEYIYILNNWFNDYQYRDVLEFIKLCNCHYFFYEIPQDFFLSHTLINTTYRIDNGIKKPEPVKPFTIMTGLPQDFFLSHTLTNTTYRIDNGIKKPEPVKPFTIMNNSIPL